ncbi:non-canonical purine NTP pyrophosphatase [Candidatus Nomurabacteria bacterium]|nr:non-canonical purine NTP pyrophosphatase [Candidatus Nomurabacteria bacterium]
MKNITYITGNQKKADYLASYLGHPISHKKVDLDEIQSLDLKKIIQHKVRQAYDIVKGPVVVEDTSFEIKTLGGLPGPFIKYFLERMTYEDICALVDGKDRSATGRCVFGYFDGEHEEYFEGSVNGTVSHKPAGEGAFGFGRIFMPEGFNGTQAELNKEDHEKMYTTMKPIKQLADFLKNLS